LVIMRTHGQSYIERVGERQPDKGSVWREGRTTDFFDYAASARLSLRAA
jgi:hypothetical protein